MDLLSDGSDEEIGFKINKNYAERYNKWRQGEELQKLKDKYGDADEGESDSSTSEEEDEDARELTKDIEKNFFRALSCLKEKNPIIYDKNVKFFDKLPEDDNEKEGKDKETKKKKKDNDFYSVSEHQRNLLLKKGRFDDDDDDDDESEEYQKEFGDMTNVEQERAIKESFKNALKDSDDEVNNEEWGGIFKKRVKTTEELANEEEDYKLWLAGEKAKLKSSEEEEELKGLHDFWTNPHLDKNEQFLKDYILNKRFLEKNDSGRIPSYDEIVHDSDSGLSADEHTLQEQDTFERKYNFRFEEPDQEFIKRYPRTVESSMRKKDDRRKRHRQEVKARKDAEKAKKTEELKRLKAFKKKEIMDKIKKLQEITGNEDIDFKKNDIEDEFDPEEHDRRMNELFNDEYYGNCQDEVKPEAPDLDRELEIENWEEWNGDGSMNQQEEEELHCEDPGFNMDCDYDPGNQRLKQELVDSCKRRKKRKQSKFAAAVAKEKPLFDPKDKSFEKYIDEYYSLDYEDLIGDLPCRFKYRKTVPNDFGLTIEEILEAPDKELNSWVSVKRIMQRRLDCDEKNDVKTFRERAKNFNKKRKFFPSLYGDIDEKQNGNESKEEDFRPPGQKKKRGSNNQEVQNNFSNSKWNKRKNEFNSNRRKNRFKDRCSKFNPQEPGLRIPDERIKSYGINPKTFKKKLVYGSKK